MELCPLIQNSVQQGYFPVLYPRYLPLLKSVPYFDVALLHPTCVYCPPSPERMWETLGMEKVLPKSQKCNYFPH